MMPIDDAESKTRVWWCCAPAKLNLYLELLGKRPDGFHELETVMMAISLCDTLLFAPNSSGSLKLILEDSRVDRQHDGLANPQDVPRFKSESVVPVKVSTSQKKMAPNDEALECKTEAETKDLPYPVGHDRRTGKGSRSLERGKSVSVDGPRGSGGQKIAGTIETNVVKLGDRVVGEQSNQSEESPSVIPTGGDNLVIKALELLRSSAKVKEGATIRLLKRIPSQAGLGGASSDAAAALLLANRGWDLNWSREKLAELAGEIGSDVPFFFTQGFAIARGRGERIEALPHPGKVPLVVVKPPLGLSTPEVFRHCEIPPQPRTPDRLLQCLKDGDWQSSAQYIHNRLQPAASQLTDWISRLRDEFKNVGCLGHGMSGSGSSYFGLFQHRRQAEQAARLLNSRRVGAAYAVHATDGIRPMRP